MVYKTFEHSVRGSHQNVGNLAFQSSRQHICDIRAFERTFRTHCSLLAKPERVLQLAEPRGHAEEPHPAKISAEYRESSMDITYNVEHKCER
jgi:hypothetical protein